MPVSVWVGEEAALEHLVERGFNAGNKVRWGKGYLFSFGMVVLGIAVKNELANGNEWVVTMGPDLGDVVHIKAISVSIFDGHELNVPGP